MNCHHLMRLLWSLLFAALFGACPGVTATTASALSRAEGADTAPCRLTIAVLNSDGSPVAGAKLALRREVDFKLLGAATATSDAAGKATFATKTGYQRVSAHHDDYIPTAQVRYCPKPTGPFQRLRHKITELNMRLTLPIKGSVRIHGLATTAQGLVGGLEVSVVELLMDKSKRLFPYPTAVPMDTQAGTFDFTVQPGRHYIIYANAPGFRFQSRELDLSDVRPARPGEFVTVGLDFMLEKEPALEVHVIGPDGEPVEGAAVLVGPFQSMVSDLRGTDRRGNVRLPVVAGRNLVVTATRGDFIGEAALGPLVPDTFVGVTIQLTEGYRVTGTLRAPAGVDLAEIAVFFRVRRTGFWGYLWPNSEGEFVVKGLPRGDVVEFYAAESDWHWVDVATPQKPTVEVFYKP